MDGEVVSADPGTWNGEQQEKAACYGTCGRCGAPRDVVTSEFAPGVTQMEFQCLNGHRGPLV